MAFINCPKILDWSIFHWFRTTNQKANPCAAFFHSTASVQKKKKKKNVNFGSTTDTAAWPSSKVRSTFLQYFQSHGHQYVPSSSVIPKKGEGSYFINAGMNQFKPIFLDEADLNCGMNTYQRVVNSQKCIRVGGKHNDLDDVGKDTTHHTFFEMLGSWSFGDYFKADACKMAWNLLTSVYGLPPEYLYVTYFEGNAALGLEADETTRDIWRSLGVPNSHILPFGLKDNFWEMAETGPCGPCTEIHFDHKQQPNAAHLVNQDNPDVVELWNLVFMQYKRLTDGSLQALPRNHVDTGMGLERLTAVLQGTMSNYDTDLFAPIFLTIQQICKCEPYSGMVGKADTSGRDIAYRVLADHSRMMTIAIGDGIRPSTKDTGAKLRQIIHRSVRYAQSHLGAPQGILEDIVPTVSHILKDAYPNLITRNEEIKSVVGAAEARYLQNVENGANMLRKAINRYNQTSHLSGEQIWELNEGRFGYSVPIDILTDLAEQHGVTLDMSGFEERMAQLKSRWDAAAAAADIERCLMRLTSEEITELQARGVPTTDNHYKYEYSIKNGQLCLDPLSAKVFGIRNSTGSFVSHVQTGEEVGVLVDRSNFYPEGGGQMSDMGFITSEDCEIIIHNVQTTKNYVLHLGKVEKGELRPGDQVRLHLNQEHRLGCMKNHTATHLLNAALNKVLGNVQQHGSNVTPQKFSFDFSCSKAAVDLTDIKKITAHINDAITKNYPVDRHQLPLLAAMKIKGLRTLAEEVYPSNVEVVSIGMSVADLCEDIDEHKEAFSVELCGGTHVHNCGDMEALVITSVSGMMQEIKRITAITGTAALQAIEDGKELRTLLSSLAEMVQKGLNRGQVAAQISQIEKELASCVIPKIERDEITETLGQLETSGLNKVKNQNIKDQVEQMLSAALSLNKDGPVAILELNFEKRRDVIDVLIRMNLDVPIMIISPIKNKKQAQGICYVPKTCKELKVRQWADHVCKNMSGKRSDPGGKQASHANQMQSLAFSTKDNDIAHAKELARTFANLYL